MSNDTACPNLEWYQAVSEPVNIISHYVVTVCYLLFGLTGHALCLAAFCQQAKKDAVYKYQVYIVASECMETFFYIVYLVTYYILGGEGDQGVKWFKSSYTLVWYTSYVVSLQVNVFITASMLLSVAMLIDRLYALKKPYLYKYINHSRHQRVAVVTCVCIGVAVNLFECFRYEVQLRNGYYDMVTGSFFTDNTVFMVLNFLRNVLHLGGLVVLLVGNAVLIRMYRVRMKKTVTPATFPGDKKEVKRKAAERTVTFLAICQSLLTSIGMTSLVSYYIGLYAYSDFDSCQGILWGPIVDIIVPLSDMLEFYIVLAVSKQFRQMVVTGVALCCHVKVTTVAVYNVRAVTNTANAGRRLTTSVV